MRPSRETVMNALLAVLESSVQTKFTASTQSNSCTLYSPSTIASLFVGLPVFGGSVPRGAYITSVSPLTISQPATANASDVCFTTGFQTVKRRLIPLSKNPPQPALFLRDMKEDLVYDDGNIQQTQTITTQIVIYSNTGQDPDAVPLTGLNNLLDAIQAAMAPDYPTGQFTIGGLVSWCRLEGTIDKDPGDLAGQAVAVADVLITVP